MHQHLLADIGLCVLGAVVMALVAKLLRQPPLLGYLAAGLLLGEPMGFGLVGDKETIQVISEIGLVLLLFLIGAEIDLNKLLRSGPAVLGGGLLQVPLCALVAVPLLWPFFGTTAQEGTAGLDLWYLALLLSLSSTAIVVKLLYEQSALDTMPGRITIGVLVVQDLWAIVMLVLQPDLAHPELATLALHLGKGLGLVVLVLLCGRYLLPHAFHFVGRSGELTLLLALAWCAIACAGAQQCGLSLEMGALLAGITISTFPVSLEVVTRVLSIRDFFVTLFFVTLGLQTPAPTAEVLALAALCSLCVLLTRALVVVPLIRAFTRDSRSAVVTAVNLAQVSEFALVIAAIGANLHHVSQRTIAVITFAMVLTAVLAPYLIGNSHQVHQALLPLLRRLGLGPLAAAEPEDGHGPVRCLLLGCYHIGRSAIEEWLHRAPQRKGELHVVDFNPDTHRHLCELGVSCTFGDVANLDLLAHLHPEHCEVIACTLPDTVLKGTTNLHLLAALRRMAPKARIIVTAEREAAAQELYRMGADYVLMPHLSGGVELAAALLAVPALPDPIRAQQHERIARLRG